MTIIVVDDHRMFRDSVVSFLEAEDFCDTALAAATVTEARTMIGEHSPQIALVDLSFPDEGGIELVKWAHTAAPDMHCIFLTMHEELGNLRSAVSAGGRGYVTKNAGYDELRSAVLTVTSGGLYLDQMMLRRVFAHLSDQPVDVTPLPEGVAELTEREREVLDLLLDDMSTAAIGSRLFISTKTVENHRSSIYRKLDVHDRLSLFNFARRNGLIH